MSFTDILIKIIETCRFNLRKIELFDIFDKEIYNWMDSMFRQ